MLLDRDREPGVGTRNPRPRRVSARARTVPLGNRATARLLTGAGPTNLGGVAHPQVALLARQAATAPPASSAKVVSTKSRPEADTFWDAYSKISYDVWSGVANVNKVWDFIGGRLRLFKPGNTCAARISYGLNYGSAPITETEAGWIYPNHAKYQWPDKTSRRKERGDGKKYIVSAPYLTKYLTKKWGRPDFNLKTNADAKDLLKTLGADEVVVFAGVHHAGVIKHGYRDPYVYTDPGVMPVSAWKLSPGSTRVIRAPI